MSLGALTIQLIEAKFTRDVKTFRKMDPYAHFDLRSNEQTWKTEVCKNGSTKPKWTDQKETFDIKYLGDDFVVKFMDLDPVCDEQIGQAFIKVASLCAYPESDMWFPLTWKNKKAGDCHLKATWVPRTPSPAEVQKKEHQSEISKAQEALK